MYDLLASFDIHGMCILVFCSFVFIGIDFSGFLTMDFFLALPFLDIHGVTRLFLVSTLDYLNLLDLGEVVSRKFPKA